MVQSLTCANCGAGLPPPSPSAPLRCIFCGTVAAQASPAPAFDPTADRNGNGIPDVLEAPVHARPINLGVVPPAPRTPSPRARDIVFGYQGKQRIKLIIGLVFCVVGLIPTLLFGWTMPVDLALDVAGDTYKGTVVSAALNTNVRINKRHPTRIVFTYKVDGVKYEGDSSTLKSSIVSRAAPGSAVTVEALSSFPSLARIEGTTFGTMGYAGGFTLIFPLVGAFLALHAYRENQREIRAFTIGLPTLANVTFRGLDRTSKSNGRHPYKVEWALTVDGKRYTGSISHMEPSALGELLSGPQIIALYDPKDPNVNTVYIA